MINTINNHFSVNTRTNANSKALPITFGSLDGEAVSIIQGIIKHNDKMRRQTASYVNNNYLLPIIFAVIGAGLLIYNSMTSQNNLIQSSVEKIVGAGCIFGSIAIGLQKFFTNRYWSEASKMY